MGYAIVSNDRINGKEPKNWHIFKADIKVMDNNNKQICIELNSMCKEFAGGFLIAFIKHPFFYYLLDNIGNVNNTSLEGFYYSSTDNTVYYSDSEDIIRSLAAILGKKVCGSCVSSLYADDK